MKRTFKLFALILVLCLVFGLFVACDKENKPEVTNSDSSVPAEKPSTEEVSVAVFWRSFDDQYQSGFRILMQNEVDSMEGIKVEMYDCENDATTFVEKVQLALTKGYDYFAICPIDQELAGTLKEICAAENVPTVFFNTQPYDDVMEAYDDIWYVGSDAYASGQMCAQALANYWKANTELADRNGDGKLQVVFFQGELGSQDTLLRTQAYKDTLTENGIEYEILYDDIANWDKGQAMDKMTAWITATGIDKFEGVLANNDSMAMGALQAIINAGYNQGNAEEFVPCVGIDATVEALEAMKAGTLLGTVLGDRKGQSVVVLNICKLSAADETINADNIGYACDIDGKFYWVPYQIVDSTNLDSVLEMMTALGG